MFKKRLIGVVTVKDGWAVQSFGYQRHLPLGRVECLVENLDRWGADEILIQVIDRSTQKLGPDFALIERIGALGLSTPLVYAGGLRGEDDAVMAVQLGADRVVVDALLREQPSAVEKISKRLGAQALIAALPVAVEDGKLKWWDYRCAAYDIITPELVKLLSGGVVSETLLIDWKNEGHAGTFDQRILDLFEIGNCGLIAFGGLSDVAGIARALERKKVVAVGVGNTLNYTEHTIQTLKRKLNLIALREANYRTDYV